MASLADVDRDTGVPTVFAGGEDTAATERVQG
jgi:hypothetical protein